MKLKNIVKATLVAASLAASSFAMAGGPDLAPAPVDPTQDMIHAYVSASAYFADKTEIATGFDNDTNVHLTQDLNRKVNYTTFVPELGLWFPLWSNHEDMIVNFVTFANWVPGTNVHSSGTDDNERYDVRLHDHMFNFGVGLNLLYYFTQRWFAMAMLGGGVNYYYVHSDFESTDPAADNDRYTGTSSIYRALFTAKVGIGMNVSEKSQVLFFGRYTGVNSRTLFVADSSGGGGATNTNVVIRPPHCWWEVGVQFTRAFSL